MAKLMSFWNAANRREPIYLEQYLTRNKTFVIKCELRRIDDRRLIYVDETDFGYDCGMDLYNKGELFGWRPWDELPSNEERADVPWNHSKGTDQIREDQMGAIVQHETKEPRLLTVEDFEQSDDYGYLPAVFEPRDMKDFVGAWEWDLITASALSRNDGRYWNGLASDDLREATAWTD